MLVPLLTKNGPDLASSLTHTFPAAVKLTVEPVFIKPYVSVTPAAFNTSAVKGFEVVVTPSKLV